MDYEKKYNEALQRAKDFKDGIVHHALEPGESIVGWIFPELRESEDERTYRELKGYLDKYISDSDLRKKRFFAWLEKHKEQKPSYEDVYSLEKVLEDELDKRFDIHPQAPSCIHALALSVAAKMSLGQKPVGLSEEDEKMLARCLYDLAYLRDSSHPNHMERYNDEIEWLKAKLKEQKPYEPKNWPADKDTLTQEQKPAQDYSGLTDLERAIHRGFLCAGVENVPRTIIEETAKDCLAQMKPAAWSEEDEKVYEYLKDGFEYATNNPELLSSRLSGKNDATIQDYKNFIDKLNSIRPQPRWKPSEEQMKLLSKTINTLRNIGCGYLAENLESIREHLKD